MIVAGSASPLLLSSAGGYNLTNSLRFRSSASAFLNRTPASAGNRKTFTFSAWIKRGELSTSEYSIFTGYTDANNRWYVRFEGNAFRVYWNVAGSSNEVATSAVFRDPSSWYHFVVAVDTTQATDTNRIKIYVNGVQQTLTGTYIPQNTDTQWNNNVVQQIGRKDTGGGFFDGYLDEINSIDGQALTPSSFGSFNAQTGVWQPIRYTGTYGTNGFYLPFTDRSTASFAGSFNGSNQFLSLAQNAAFSFGTGDFTVETFINANSWGSVNPIIALGNGAVGGGSPVYSGWAVRYDSSGSLIFFRYDGVETTPTATITLATGQWYHIAVSRSSGTLRMFVNGTQVYSAASSTSYNNVNSDTLKIGGNWVIGGGVTTWINGQISNTRIVKGTGLYTANFTVPTQNLTAVSGTSLLTLQNTTIIDNSPNNFTITNNNSVTTSVQNPFASGSITSDQSGNANNWFSNNINTTTLGVTYDSMTDVPTLTNTTTANYAVLNPLGGVTTGGPFLVDGNLNYGQGAAAWSSCGSTIQPNTGKWYFEVSGPVSGSNYSAAGFRAVGNISSNEYAGSSTGSYGGVQTSGVITAYANGSAGSGISGTFSINTPIQVAVDFDAGKIWFGSLNGTWIGGGNPASGTSPTYTFTANTQLNPYVSAYANNTYANFGQRPFIYTVPSGFNRLNAFNLPSSTIVAGNKQFDATTYTGNGTAITVTNSGAMQPDFVWVKSRSSTQSSGLYNVISGVGKYLVSNTTNAEVTYLDTLTSFNSNGFSAGNDSSGSGINTNGTNYVSWQWKAGGAAVTNTTGSISAQVSANPAAGFSIATYTGTGSNATVGHGLGVAPAMIIIKSRNNLSNAWNWMVYQKTMTATSYAYLNLTNAKETSSGLWNNTEPTSSVFTIGSNGNVNAASNTYVAYCWAEIAGFSRFGSYTGNGSADGTFVFTGFRPKYVIVKRTDAIGHWIIKDTARNPSNIATLNLYSDLSNAEDSAAVSDMDLLSNGFKLRGTYIYMNASGGNYIYMAFAENPFKNSLAR
jgi:hypothetical protein